mmetsp:Transcript_53624/g.117641  ORF Transcript_53624/g.117641 Transcript_53624/m.117641 type:complete len:165 (+) Transcript_53624:50-544(+)
MEFPCFRSEEWIKKNFEGMEAPAEVLDGVDLSPTQMMNTPNIGFFPGKVAAVREGLRKSLFRQALFQVQNVEVTYMQECRDMRLLREIVERQKGSNLVWNLYDRVTKPRDVELMREERWTVDRCQERPQFDVRYYNEGGGGYSVTVVPVSWADRWHWIQFMTSD